MKRNWDVIRELLIEVEALDTDQRHRAPQSGSISDADRR